MRRKTMFFNYKRSFGCDKSYCLRSATDESGYVEIVGGDQGLCLDIASCISKRPVQRFSDTTINEVV